MSDCPTDFPRHVVCRSKLKILFSFTNLSRVCEMGMTSTNKKKYEKLPLGSCRVEVSAFCKKTFLMGKCFDMILDFVGHYSAVMNF